MTNMATESTVNKGKTSKVDRYDWKLLDEKGLLLDVNKYALQVDDSYQREANSSKVLNIAKAWSWVACGVIIIAKRGEDFFVIDGQHRVLAARRRDDIQYLPCVVFQSISIKEEARGFLLSNTNRKPITSIDRFKSLTIIEDPAALIVEKLIKESGRGINNAGGAKNIACISLLLSLAKSNGSELQEIWPLVLEICDGQQIHQKLIEGLMYIHLKISPEQSISKGRWRQRIKQIGAKSLVEGAVKAASFYARGGAKVYAAGMIEVLNKGLHSKLSIAE